MTLSPGNAIGAANALVIDDLAQGRKIHRAALEGKGWQVLTARNLEEARAHAGRELRLVVTDLELSRGQGGIDTARRVKAMFPRAELHVVTASTDDPELVEELQNEGFIVHPTGDLDWVWEASEMSDNSNDGWLNMFASPVTRATVIALMLVILKLGWDQILEMKTEQAVAMARIGKMEEWFHEEQLRTQREIAQLREANSRDLGQIREANARLATIVERLAIAMDRRPGSAIP